MAKIIIEIEYPIYLDDYSEEIQKSSDPEQAAVEEDQRSYQLGVCSLEDLLTWGSSINVEFEV